MPGPAEKNEILITYENDPLNGMTAGTLIEKLRESLLRRVSAAYFFGSFGTDRFNKFSDIDLILVCNTNKPFVERPLDFSDLLDITPDMDILVYTPREFSKLTSDPSTGFWTSVTKELRQFI